MDLIRHAINLNWGAYYFFNFQATNRAAVLRPLMEGMSLLGSYLAQAIVLAAALGLLVSRGKYRQAVGVFVISMLGVVLVEGIRGTVVGSRPPVDAASGISPVEMLRGFPARAVFLSFLGFLNLALALEQLRADKRWLIVANGAAVLLALLVTVSQLFLGLYFLTDVLAGMTLGIGLALLCRGLTLPRMAVTAGDKSPANPAAM